MSAAVTLELKTDTLLQPHRAAVTPIAGPLAVISCASRGAARVDAGSTKFAASTLPQLGLLNGEAGSQTQAGLRVPAWRGEHRAHR